MRDLSADQLARLDELMRAFYERRDDSKLTEIFILFDKDGNG